MINSNIGSATILFCPNKAGTAKIKIPKKTEIIFFFLICGLAWIIHGPRLVQTQAASSEDVTHPPH